MLERTVLYDRDLVRVRHVACHTTGRHASPIEHAQLDSFVMPLRGAFLQHFSPSREVLADANHALLYAEGRAHRISHPLGDGDECLALDVAADALRDVLIGEAGVDRLADVQTHALLPPPAVAARSLLYARLRRGIAGELETEETSLEIVRRIVRAAARRHVSTAPRRANVEAVRLTLLDEPGEKWTYAELAARDC